MEKGGGGGLKQMSMARWFISAISIDTLQVTKWCKIRTITFLSDFLVKQGPGFLYLSQS